MASCPACGAENPDGARFCNACGAGIPEAGAAAEVRKTVTVIFCDVTGSTALGERLDPEALRRVMTRYFATMTKAIERHGGTVEKFIGDAVMAVFGIPTTHEDDATRAVRAADDMREALRLLNKELERDHGTTLACRVGVNTGEVVAGDASVRQALVTGDAVNVAARLEQAAPPGEVLIAEATWRLVRDAAVTEPVAPIEAKGKSEPLRAYRLIAINQGAAGVARRLDSPLVGRERPLAQLAQAFGEAEADRVCHLFTVLGPSGVGKSRFVQEALERFGGRAGVLRGRCLSYGEGITYWPLAEAIHDALGAGVEPTPAAVEALMPADANTAEVAARIAQLAGDDQDLQIAAEEIGWAVRRFLEGLAQQRPLILVFDDLHWAEPGLLDLIDQITDWSRDAPILVIAMARPDLLDLRPGWGGGKLHASTVALEPLSAEESSSLIANLLAGGQIDDAARAKILTASEGNPLFLEETLAMLVDDGLLRHEEDRWVATGDLSAVAVPPTIHALLEARLDRLGPAERAALGRAAVVGQIFYLGAVRDLAPESERDGTAASLQHLLRRDLIRPDRTDLPGEEAFRFHHGLLRDSAYTMLPKETRADLHERLAEWLDERLVATEADEFVGYHLEQAHAYRAELGSGGDGTLSLKAAERLSSAAVRAERRGDITAAAGLYQRAAALREPSDPTRVRDLVGAGWALVDRERGKEALDAFEQAEAAASASGDPALVANAELGATFVRGLIDPEGGTDALRDSLEWIIPTLEAAGDDGGLTRALLCRGQVGWMMCRYSDAREAAGQALVRARAAGNITLVRQATATRGAAGYFGRTTTEEMRLDSDDLEALAATNPSLRPEALQNKAMVLGLVGAVDEARTLYDQAFALATELYGSVGGAKEGRSNFESMAGDLDAAEMWIRLHHDELIEKGLVGYSSTAAGEWALILYLQGRFDEARRLADACRTTSASDDAINQVLWRQVMALLEAHGGRFDEAERLIREMEPWIDATEMLIEHVKAALAEAEVWRMAGRPADQRSALERARAIADRKGAKILVDRADTLLAEMDAAQ